MNKIYKIIWNKARNCYIVVSEIAKRNGKCSSSLNKKIIASFLAAGTVLSVTGSAWAEETSSFPVGVAVTGTDNIIKGYDTTYFDTYPLNGAFTSIYGAYNTLNIEKLPGDNVTYTPYSGIANTINGFGNFVKNANGVQIFGAGNTLNDMSSPLNLSDDENTIINDKIAILNAQESTENQKKAARDKINEILKKHLNETSSNLIVGMNNTLQGGQIQTSQYMNRHNIVVGFENSTQHIKETSIIGYGNNIKNTKDDIIIGNGHIWEGKSPSTPSQNNIILGKWDQEGGHVSNVQTLLDNVIIGHNADVNKPHWYTEEPPVMNGGVMYSVAIGSEATVTDDAAIAVGKRAVALKDSSVAIGTEAIGAADSAIAVGKKAVAKGTDAIAIGKGALAENQKSTTAIAIGADSHADGERATAIGQGAYAEGLGAITIGKSAMKKDVDGNELGKGAMGTNAISIGEQTLAKGNNAVSIGGDGQAIGEQTTAIGYYSKATSDYATAVGSGANATGAQSTATGAYSQAKGDYSVALGTFANYYGDERKGGITAVGYNSAVTVDNGVALGRGSVANTEKNVAGYDPTTGKASTDTSKTWKSTMGAVSVGSSTNTRQITNVAAGYEDTDAVNVAQLKAAMTSAGGVEIKQGSNISVDAQKKEGGGTVYTISSTASGGSNVKVINGKNTIVTEGKEGNFVTYAVDVMTDGKVTSGDTGIITGETVYNEVRVKKDGNYIKKDNTAAENITALDEKVYENTQNIENIGNQINNTNNQINSLDNRMRKGLAGAAALAALHPMDFNPDDKLQFSAGVGNYRGETAAALGAFYRPDESVMFSIGGTFGNADNMVNAGITFGLDGTRNRTTRSRTAMAKEIVELREHIAKQDEQIAQLTNLVNKLVAPEQRLENPFEPEQGRIYVERISGQDNDQNKIERVRVNNSDSKYPEGKNRDVYGSKIQPVVSEKAAAQ